MLIAAFAHLYRLRQSSWMRLEQNSHYVGTTLVSFISFRNNKALWCAFLCHKNDVMMEIFTYPLNMCTECFRISQGMYSPCANAWEWVIIYITSNRCFIDCGPATCLVFSHRACCAYFLKVSTRRIVSSHLFIKQALITSCIMNLFDSLSIPLKRFF